MSESQPSRPSTAAYSTMELDSEDYQRRKRAPRASSSAWGKEMGRFTHGGSVESAAFSPDGRRSVTASHDTTVIARHPIRASDRGWREKAAAGGRLVHRHPSAHSQYW